MFTKRKGLIKLGKNLIRLLFKQNKIKAEQNLENAKKAEQELNDQQTELKNSVTQAQGSLNTLTKAKTNLESRAQNEGTTTESVADFEICFSW